MLASVLGESHEVCLRGVPPVVPAGPVADGRWEVGAGRQGSQGVHPPQAGRPHHPAAGRQTVYRTPTLGKKNPIEL